MFYYFDTKLRNIENLKNELAHEMWLN